VLFPCWAIPGFAVFPGIEVWVEGGKTGLGEVCVLHCDVVLLVGWQWMRLG